MSKRIARETLEIPAHVMAHGPRFVALWETCLQYGATVEIADGEIRTTLTDASRATIERVEAAHAAYRDGR